MDLMAQREAALTELRNIKDNTKDAEFSAEDAARVVELSETIRDIDVKIKAADESARILAGISDGKKAQDAEAAPKSFGDAYVKSAGYATVKEGRYGQRVAVKANTDIHGLEGLGEAFDSTRDLGIRSTTDRDALTIFDWLKPVYIDEAAVKWVEETADEGDFESVKPGEQKPQLHFGYAPKSAALVTAAGWFDSHVSLIRRAPEFAARINERGLRKLRLDQERMLLTATESSDGFNGILNTSGIGTVTAGTKAAWLDAIYDAITQAETMGDYPVDGIVISRADWGVLRKTKDAQGAYLMGNPFGPQLAGQSLFGTPVFVSSQLTAGTALVGASENATFYLDRQVYVDVTNSDQDKFTKNIVTTRIEQDMLGVVERPSGLVKVTLTNA